MRFRRRRHEPPSVEVRGVTTGHDEVRAASNPTAPNRLWIADVNSVRTEEGWLYQAVVLDCYSRRCLGWWAGAERDSALLHHAVELATSRRWPSIGLAEAYELKQRAVPLTFAPRCRLTGLSLTPGPASINDLAVAEYFATMLRRDLIDPQIWTSRRLARNAISDWILGYYNPESAPAERELDLLVDLDELSH